jgi:DNA-binding transcriptional LysR family regulator
LLDKLRTITGDPLFVKSGRGIVATAHAGELALRARELLGSMERFAMAGVFDPAAWETTITIAANDFQRDLLLPQLAARLRASAPGVILRVIPSGIPTLEMMRDDHCQLVISPRPPDGSDILQKRLFEDQYKVFFDPSVRSAPKTKADYLAAGHVTVVYAPHRALDLDQWFLAKGIQRRFSVLVPGFAGLPHFIRGSELVATVPGLLQSQLFRGLACAKVPVPCPRMPMYMIWHLRHRDNPAHRWLRSQIEALVPLALVMGASPDPVLQDEA